MESIGPDAGQEGQATLGPLPLAPPSAPHLIPVAPGDLPLDLHKILPTKRPYSDFLLDGLNERFAGPARSHAASAANALPGPVEDALRQLFLVAVGAVASLIAFILGFRHVNAGNVLTSSARRRILGALKARPGIGVRELASETGMSPATAHHHLRQLERVGVVRRQRLRGKSLSYPVDGGAAARMSSLVGAFSRDAASREILELLESEGARSRSEIARALTIAHGSVGWRIGKMLDAGLVEEIDGRRLKLRGVPGPAKPPSR